MKKGMTLTELLIVVSIIAFLSVLVTGFLRTQVFKGNDARRKADMNRIGIALEEYEKDNNCYPLPSLVACEPGTGLRPYLDKISCDPINNASYFYEHEDSICPKWYRIYSSLDNDNDNDYVANIGPNSAFNYYAGSPNAPVVVSGGGEIILSNYYGCFNGICTQIGWDTSRPGPVCDPSYQNSSCYGQCANPSNECQDWNQ